MTLLGSAVTAQRQRKQGLPYSPARYGIQGRSAPRSDPLLFHSPLLTEKESLSLLNQNVETSKNESASYIN